MKILAIIQARVGSIRLPGKVLMKLEDKTVLEHVVNRIKQSKLITEVIIATTTNKEDKKIVDLCKKNKIKVYRGSENNVLDRLYQTAKLYHPEHVVRITADCPIIDPKIIDDVIDYHLKNNADYTANTLELTYPDGEDVEVITFKTLKEAWQKANLASELEHVTLYIRNHTKDFVIKNLKHKVDLSFHRWTIDNREDYELIKIIYNHFYPKNKYFGMDMIVKFLSNNPQLLKINQQIARNEGLQKSLQKDRILKQKPYGKGTKTI